MQDSEALFFLRDVVIRCSCLSLEEVRNWSRNRGTRFINEWGNPMAELDIMPSESDYFINIVVTDNESGEEITSQVVFYDSGEVYISANYSRLGANGVKLNFERLFASDLNGLEIT